MEKDMSHTPPPRDFDAQSSLVQTIDDWVAKEGKLISARKRIERRFIREMMNATTMRLTEAEALFEMLVQSRRQARVDTAEKRVVRSTREYVYQDRSESLLKLRAKYARWAIDFGHARWAIDFGQHTPRPLYSEHDGSMCVPDRSGTTDGEADGSRHQVVVSFPQSEDSD